MGAKEERIKRERLERTTSERLAEIVAAAERAATRVIDDAEREASRQLAEAQTRAEDIAAARIAALTGQTDSLIAHAEEIRQRSEQLLAALSRLKGELEADRADEGPLAGGGRAHLSAVAPLGEAPEPVFASGGHGGSAGARLLATQMAVLGSSREEIAARLRNGFEIDDPEAILDAILGPEG